MASTSEMRDALQGRYERAKQDAEDRGVKAQAIELEIAGSQTSAVVSMNLSKFKEFISTGSALYSNYHLQVRAGVRQASDPQDDRMRLAVDGSVHGTYGAKISYAALAVDGVGVSSYGNLSLSLREVAVASRSTVLEQNSWMFVQRRDLFGKILPPGFVAIWEDRCKLVVAKLAGLLTPEMSQSEIRSLILTQASKREEEEFLEVHIYGTFNCGSIESVTGASNMKDPLDVALVAWVKDKLASLGKPWIER
jgi:hypothetical protein